MSEHEEQLSIFKGIRTQWEPGVYSPWNEVPTSITQETESNSDATTTEIGKIALSKAVSPD